LNGAGGSISWAIKHRGRSGTDTAQVRFGPDLSTLTTVVTMTDGKTAWGSYSGTYSIPVGQTTIVLAFTAISSTGGLSYGNFIDDVQIIINQNCIDTDGDTVADILDVDSDNDGIPDIEEAGFKMYSNGKSTMDRTSGATWADANANGINDYIDSRITAGTYSIPDTDADTVYNHLDLDSDNDSLWDVNESNLLNGDGDINDDGKGDGADTDGDGLLNLFDNWPVLVQQPGHTHQTVTRIRFPISCNWILTMTVSMIYKPDCTVVLTPMVTEKSMVRAIQTETESLISLIPTIY
jgi:hypothetical protein